MADKIYLACDHGGFSLKPQILERLSDFQVEDLGTHSEDSVDYPDYADRVAERLAQDPQARGILICGSGQGMAMRANKYQHIRAALCWSKEVAQLAREHNNANVLCLGARLLESDLALEILDSFLQTPFAGGRHQTRVEKLTKDI